MSAMKLAGLEPANVLRFFEEICAIPHGSGNTKLNFAVAIIDGMISRVGIAALLGFALGMGCQGFWYGDALAGFMPMVIGMCYFLSGKWKK